MNPNNLNQRIDAMTANVGLLLSVAETRRRTAENLSASLAEAQHELALERERQEAPERARAAIREAQRELADLKRQARADQYAATGSLALANIAADAKAGS